MICAACDKPLKSNAYSWTMGWSRPDGLVNTQHRKDFEVRFHNETQCINKMIQRVEEYSWEKSMYNALSSVYGDSEGEVLEVYDV